jgi:uncharacterized membrane protein
MLGEQVHAFAELLARLIELVGVVIIIGGDAIATAAYLRYGLRTADWRWAYDQYRSNLGRAILLGLVLLVAADIISTITAPLTFDGVGLLAATVKGFG